MIPPHSRISAWTGYFIAALLLCLVLIQRKALDDLSAQTPKRTSTNLTAEGRRFESGQPAGSASAILGGLLADSQNAELLNILQEIAETTVPGEPNARLIQAAERVLMDNDFERRTRNFGILLSKMRPEDCVAMHENFEKMHQAGLGYADEYRIFSTQWGKLDAVGALSFYFKTPDGDFTPDDVHNVLKGWSQVNPSAALAWVDENMPQPLNGMDPRAAIYRGWARQDPDAATASMLEKCTDSRQRVEAARFIFYEHLASKGLDATLVWLNGLPTSGEDGAAMSKSILGSINRLQFDGRSSSEHVAKTWLSLGDADWIGLRQFEDLANSCRSGRQALMEQLNAPASLPVLQSQFLRWSQEDADAVGNWLNKNASSPLYDVAASGLVKSLANTDPAAVKIWAETIRDPAQRSQAILVLLK